MFRILRRWASYVSSEWASRLINIYFQSFIQVFAMNILNIVLALCLNNARESESERESVGGGMKQEKLFPNAFQQQVII